MATKKPTAKPKKTPKPTPTVKPTQAPVVAQKKKGVSPLLMIGGSMSVGCFCVLCLCLLMRGGKRSRGVPNVFGMGVPANKPPSGLPATLLSGILLSACVGMIASVIFMVLTRQRRVSDTVRAELYAKMLEATRRYTAAVAAHAERFEKYSRDVRRVEAQNRRTALENSWIFKPLVVPGYELVPRFVLLGRVLGEYATMDEARKACNETQNATHIQVDKKTGRAVIKTILELPEEFGTESSTATTLTKRCGEGFHAYMDTYMHPRFFLLNEVNRIVNRDWQDVTFADLLETQAAQEKKKAQMNEACLLGKSGTCIWESGGKEGIFGIVSLAFALVGVCTAVFTAGMTLLPSLLIEVAAAGVEVAFTVGLPMGLSKQQQKEADALADRMKMLKTGEILLCNSYLGEKESWWGLYNRLTLPECSADKGKLEYAFWAPEDYGNKVPDGTYRPNADGWGKIIPYQFALYEKLKKYEELPVDHWNCDEITGLLKAHPRFKLTDKNGDVKMHSKGPNACRDADAAYKFS